jgi:hypothetical protein
MDRVAVIMEVEGPAEDSHTNIETVYGRFLGKAEQLYPLLFVRGIQSLISKNSLIAAFSPERSSVRLWE